MADLGLGFKMPPRIEALREIAENINFDENIGTVDDWLEFYEKTIAKLRHQEYAKAPHNMVAVCRCKDCKHLECSEDGSIYLCLFKMIGRIKPDDFCSYGERKGGEG